MEIELEMVKPDLSINLNEIDDDDDKSNDLPCSIHSEYSDSSDNDKQHSRMSSGTEDDY